MKMFARWDFKIVDCWLSMNKPLKVYTSLIHKNTIPPPPKKKSNWGRGAHAARSAFELMIFEVYMIYSLTLVKCGMGEGSWGGGGIRCRSKLYEHAYLSNRGNWIH